MSQILFLRHGPTQWNADDRVQGWTDIPLSDAGREKVRRWKIPPEFSEFSWWSSTLSRARETAKLLSGGDCPADDRLREANWGDWEGEILTELRARMGEVLAKNEARGLDLSPPSGESPRMVCDRLAAWVADVAPAQEPITVVTHAGVFRSAYTLATGWDMKRAAPLERGHGIAHLYDVTKDGVLSVNRLNIWLVPKDDD